MSPRSASQNAARRADSRRRIVEAALRLFAEHGYDGTTIRMLAESAGISQGLVYRYFASKEMLLQAIFEQSMEDVRMSFAAADSGVPGQRVAGLVRASFAILRRNELFWRLSYAVRMQPAVRAVLGERTQSWMAEIRQTLERYLRDDGVADPAHEAVILFALIDGVAQHYVLEPEVYPLDEVADRIVAAYAR